MSSILLLTALAASTAFASPCQLSSSSSVASTAAAVAATSASAVVTPSAPIAANSTSAAATSAATTAAGNSSSGTFEFIGINESGPEFGETNIPGVLGTDYTWPNMTTIDGFIAQGMNTFRVNFLMERLIPTDLTGSMNGTYASDLNSTVSYITSKGAYAMLTPHNYGRYYNNIITDTAGFKAWWTTVAKAYASNEKVIFDTNNEYHDMEQTLVVSLNQAAIDGIRAAGATTQYITAEGNAYTGAWTWATATSTDGKTNADTMANLTDPNSKLLYQMHQYLDSDGSGTNEACVNNTIGADRLVSATAWLRSNNAKGLIGEFAGAVNDVCEEAVTGMLEYMAQNTDVWTGAVWWAAGPWWADYMFSVEPADGVAYSTYTPMLQKYGVSVA